MTLVCVSSLISHNLSSGLEAIICNLPNAVNFSMIQIQGCLAGTDSDGIMVQFLMHFLMKFVRKSFMKLSLESE